MKIGDAIRLVVQRFHLHPYDINCGDCEAFAGEVCDLVPGAESDWADAWAELFPTDAYEPDCHCIILHEGLFYDAEQPEGVKTPTLLPLFLRQSA